ncbi:hypothetical protein [Blastococcus tunisiensis]|uniref:Uncharacterized protein n=1 Tax=Blastococcus tunisiensis TaxID=1798228 RepID=A0A1I2B791_9ACTN|nr:hypothetical protein [Blastococcus sp. DSM 46838]SFE51929.1 hypothetical protein SAMN05216574_10473 [Blastococcus sp. DSM 46838]
MTALKDVAELLEQVPGVSDIDGKNDRVESIVGTAVRCLYNGQRTIAVGTDTKTQIGGLLDLIDLHLHGQGDYKGVPVAADEVTLFLADDAWDTEAEGALRTLAALLDAEFRVNLRRLTSRAEVLPISRHGLDDLGDHEKYRYSDWRGYFEDLCDQSSALVQRILAGVPRESFRAYPMLTNKGRWSLRLEGLEVAQVGQRRGWVDVAKDYLGKRGPERTAWLAQVPEGRLEVTEEEASVDRAIHEINRFADAWGDILAAGVKQNEHALESRVLRGAVPIPVSTGELQLIGGRDDRVSWGSQFPTRWGRTSSNAGRYLDALLRDGSTPWALELKIEGSGGVGNYYRHAVEQAVLYRQFIRQATPLASWFERFDLDHRACGAAVVVPEFRSGSERWAERLRAVCGAFDVELVTVPVQFAEARTLP